MAVERASVQDTSAEIVYVVIPPSISRPAPSPTLLARIHFVGWKIKESQAYSEFLGVMHAAIGAVFLAVLCCIGLYGLYYLKSVLGIDMFPDKHLEDFVPVPGYHRW